MLCCVHTYGVIVRVYDNKWAWFIASLFVNNCSGARVGSVAKASGND